jgi:hypothetical protein
MKYEQRQSIIDMSTMPFNGSKRLREEFEESMLCQGYGVTYAIDVKDEDKPIHCPITRQPSRYIPKGECQQIERTRCDVTCRYFNNTKGEIAR